MALHPASLLVLRHGLCLRHALHQAHVEAQEAQPASQLHQAPGRHKTRPGAPGRGFTMDHQGSRWDFDRMNPSFGGSWGCFTKNWKFTKCNGEFRICYLLWGSDGNWIWMCHGQVGSSRPLLHMTLAWGVVKYPPPNPARMNESQFSHVS